MPTLTQDAQDIIMTHRCPHCGHCTTRQGSSFRTIRHYQCSACGKQVRLDYRDKLKLYGAYAAAPESLPPA
jgi:transposase-like protein